MREISVDLPAFGKPTRPTSASSFNSSRRPLFFARLSGFMLGGRLMRRRGEVLVAPPAPAAARDDEPLARLREIVQQLAGVVVVDHGAHRHGNIDGCALAARAIAAFAVPPALGRVFGIETEMQQRVVVLAGDKN